MPVPSLSQGAPKKDAPEHEHEHQHDTPTLGAFAGLADDDPGCTAAVAPAGEASSESQAPVESYSFEEVQPAAPSAPSGIGAGGADPPGRAGAHDGPDPAPAAAACAPCADGHLDPAVDALLSGETHLVGRSVDLFRVLVPSIVVAAALTAGWVAALQQYDLPVRWVCVAVGVLIGLTCGAVSGVRSSRVGLLAAALTFGSSLVGQHRLLFAEPSAHTLEVAELHDQIAWEIYETGGFTEEEHNAWGVMHDPDHPGDFDELAWDDPWLDLGDDLITDEQRAYEAALARIQHAVDDLVPEVRQERLDDIRARHQLTELRYSVLEDMDAAGELDGEWLLPETDLEDAEASADPVVAKIDARLVEMGEDGRRALLASIEAARSEAEAAFDAAGRKPRMVLFVLAVVLTLPLTWIGIAAAFAVGSTSGNVLQPLLGGSRGNRTA